MRFNEPIEVTPSDLSRECLDKQPSGAFHQILPIEDQEEESVREAVIVCRECRNHITDPSRRVSVDGAHYHTFANPHGHIFEIGCFQSADGCRGIGPASKEFTWFKGYDWQIVVCSGCMAHLGWFFSAAGDFHFFGLILDRLISP